MLLRTKHWETRRHQIFVYQVDHSIQETKPCRNQKLFTYSVDVTAMFIKNILNQVVHSEWQGKFTLS